MKKVEALSSEQRKKFTDGEKMSYALSFDPPLSLVEGETSLSSLLAVYSSSFMNVRYELLVLNGNAAADLDETTDRLKALINMMSQAGEKSGMEDSLQRKEKSISRLWIPKRSFWEA